MIRLSIPYSLACGVFLSSLFALSFYFGLNPILETSQLLFDVIVFGLFSFFLVKDYKQRSGNVLHFWQGISLTFLLSVGATVLFLLALGVYESIEGSLVINYKEAATTFLVEKKDLYKSQFGDDAFNSQLDRIQKVTFPELMFSIGLKKVLAGLFLGPVITIILRTKPN